MLYNTNNPQELLAAARTPIMYKFKDTYGPLQLAVARGKPMLELLWPKPLRPGEKVPPITPADCAPIGSEPDHNC